MTDVQHNAVMRRVRRGHLPAPERAFALAVPNFAAGVLALAVILPGGGFWTALGALAGFALGAALTWHGLHRGYPHARLGGGNLVTFARLAMTSALIAPMLAGVGASWPVFALAVIALSLDGVDGWLARRQGLVSRFGARFDMEVDSALALVLALNAFTGGAAGWAVLVLGLPRYLFIAAGAVLPWMRRDLPERFSRKAICVAQLGALIALQAPILPQALAWALESAVALALLLSFGRDILWLWRRA
ncbi:CDP-alcohol phosphatidyltransferase family protein [Marivita sp. GX14005]|uniref:CDP-alcohol phosphatidyltransferase family protein n=1 Tax=Marivita sp. GX14005 TaxID=2942276 RepID=UPI002019FF18|nr:CDP-alcohol phosphatidyltransferase family protein [Marivita sp. GX14005]MCL3883236.1 CDP-alcohol phosphatidyltransferase family protein [Marivita sp. GX14005]